MGAETGTILYQPHQRNKEMKKSRKEWGCALLIVLIVVAVCAGYWAWKYYGLPEWPDRREYKSIEERAEKALNFARRHSMNEHYALFVDYSIPSGTPRLFVWDFHQKKIVASTYVMHGAGGGSTAERPCFSNRLGSGCSALGRFLVTKENGNRNKRGFRIKGMDIDNQSAYERGLMIHSSFWVDRWCWKKYIPLRGKSSLGCVTVSSRDMNYLWKLINKEEKPLLLWSFISHKDNDNC